MNSAQLSAMTHKIIEYGGEGAILRRFHSFYESGRSPALLKFKV
jgi:ATP-dependent DNA ligase